MPPWKQARRALKGGLLTAPGPWTVAPLPGGLVGVPPVGRGHFRCETT